MREPKARSRPGRPVALPAARRLSRVGSRGLAGLGLVALVMALGVASASAAPDADGQDDLGSLSSRTASVASEVATLDVRVAHLDDAVDDAWIAVQQAGEDYSTARQRLDAAKTSAHDAQARLGQALQRQESSREILVAVARDAQRDTLGTSQVGALLTADGLSDAMATANAVRLVTDKAERAVQQYRADSVVATTLQRVADNAVADLQEQKATAQSALDAANAQSAKATKLRKSVASERRELVEQLAGLRQTTEAAERHRQQKLSKARADRREEDAKRAVQDADGSATSEHTGSPSSSSSDDHRGSSSGSRDDDGHGSSPKAPEPPTTPPADPAPPAHEQKPKKPKKPAPPSQPADPPAQDPGGQLGTGVSVGSATQGAAAVRAAKKNLGKPYVWGASGPSSFDCSGLTSVAWRAAGVSLQRTSRGQYSQVRKIAVSDVRPGDLLFWGTNPAEPTSVYHVAMYVGGGQMIEAPRPGLQVRVVPVRYTAMMPYAGRP